MSPAGRGRARPQVATRSRQSSEPNQPSRVQKTSLPSRTRRSASAGSSKKGPSSPSSCTATPDGLMTPYVCPEKTRNRWPCTSFLSGSSQGHSPSRRSRVSSTVPASPSCRDARRGGALGSTNTSKPFGLSSLNSLSAQSLTRWPTFMTACWPWGPTQPNGRDAVREYSTVISSPASRSIEL